MVPNVPHVQKNAGRRQARAFKTAENPYCTTVKERVNKQMYLFTATKTTSGVLKKKKKKEGKKGSDKSSSMKGKKQLLFKLSTSSHYIYVYYIMLCGERSDN